MLKTLHLGNFKAFGEAQPIPLRPITLLFGPNSAGKSSVIHGLLLANHALKTGDLDVYQTETGGTSVDLGGFRQYVHRHRTDQTVLWAVEIETRDFEGRLAELMTPVRAVRVSVEIGMEQEEIKEKVLLPDEARFVEETVGYRAVGDPHVQVIQIEADGQRLLRMSRRPEGHLQLDTLNTDHPVIQQVVRSIIELATTSEFTEDDAAALNAIIAGLLPALHASASHLLPDGLNIALRRDAERLLFFPISQGDREKDLGNAVHFYLPRALNDLLHGLHEALSDDLTRLVYLGPLRSNPPRHLAFAEGMDPNWHAGGGRAWDVLRRDAAVRKSVNAWLSAPDRLQTPYEVRIQRQIPADSQQIFDVLYDGLSEVEQAIWEGMDGVEVERGVYEPESTWDQEEYARKLSERLADPGAVEGYDELILYDLKRDIPVSHRDVGVGVSQVMPVLVYAFASKGQIIAIEQPEIHVHPKLQAELGDVFIEGAVGERGNTFLIETHSEHLILRLLRRIRETAEGSLADKRYALTPDDVSVLYVDPTAVSAKVVPMRVTEDGDFENDWPGGFFTERERELF